MVKTSEVAKFLGDAISYFSNEYNGCFWYPLETPEGYDRDWAFVTARNDDYISVKLAYNCDDLQCDYDWDWEMPKYSNGDVCDTEMFLYFSDNERELELTAGFLVGYYTSFLKGGEC